MSRIRIIGGAFKGRRLQVLDEKGLRPTTDRVRENVFNWLQFKIRGMRCLDLFAGTGALGFEALSRGAAHVTFVELNRKTAEQLKYNIQALAIEKETVIKACDALQFLKGPIAEPYDLIFLDPPFNSNLMQQVANKIPLCENLIHDKTLLYVEHEKQQEITLDSNWSVFKYSEIGQVSYALYAQDA